MADIVCLGQQNWDYCWTGKQQLTSRLARRGHRVLYVDPDWADPGGPPARAIGRALLPSEGRGGLRRVDAGLWVYSYEYLRPLRWRANRLVRPAVTARAARRLGLVEPVVLSHRPDALPTIAALRPSATLYYAIDEWSAYGTAPEAERRPGPEELAWRRRMRELEEDQVRRADVALAISPRLLDRMEGLHPRAYLLESAADLGHFAPERLERADPHPALARLPGGPRVGFVGQIDERIDHPTLITLARARPSWQFVMAGRVKPGYDAGPLDAEPNIHLLGYLPYPALPGVLRGFDVCLAPYRRNELTESCSPLKVFEYLATGKPVVATPVAGLRTCRAAIAAAETPEGYLTAIQAALRDPSAGREGRLAVAASNTWEHRTDELERRIEEALEVAAGRRGRPPRRLRPPGGPSTAASNAAVPPADYHSEPVSPAFGLAARALGLAGTAYAGLRGFGRLVRGHRPFAVRKVLVARQARLGDLVVFLPTLRALRARYPEARIVLGVQPGMSAAAVLAGTRTVDEVRELDFLARPTRLGRLAGLARLFGEGFDLVLAGTGYFLLREAFLAGAPSRVGLEDGHPWQRLNGRILPLDPTRHESENNLALVEALGGRIDPAERAPRLAVDRVKLHAAWRRVAARLDLDDSRPILALHPGSQKPSRRWPAGRFAELAARLLAERPALQVVFTGTAGEIGLIEAIRESMPTSLRERVRVAAGRTDLDELMSLLDRCDAYVCNDTGVLHVARALGTPLVALLGPENDRRWGPHPDGPGPATALRHVVPCAPCNRWDCEALYCLRSLHVAEVAAEVGRMLELGRAGTLPTALERRLHTHDWADLAAAEFPLPGVWVVVPDHSDGFEESDLSAASADARAQDYPDVVVVPAIREVGSTGSTGEGGFSPSDAEGDSPSDDVYRIVARPGERRPPTWISSRVAALIRGEDVPDLVLGPSTTPELPGPEAGPESAAVDGLRSA